MPKQEDVAALYFALIGIGYLFPFSAMSQPADYWSLLFPSFNILFLISLVFMGSNIVVLSALVFFEKENSNESFKWRILLGFAGQLVALIIVPSTYFLKLNMNDNAVVILCSTAFMAVVTALLDSSVIALAGCFPLKCQEYLQLGIGLSTLIGSIYRIVTKLVFPATTDGTIVSSLIYFYTGALTIGACIIGFLFMLRMPFSRKCLQNDRHADIDTSDDKEALLGGKADDGLDISQEHEIEGDLNVMEAVKKSFINGLSVAFLFFVTLAAWPAMVSSLPTYQFPGLQETGWWPLLLLFIFAITDVVGRFTVRFRFGFNRHNIWIAVLVRICLLPVLVMMAKGIYLRHDALSILITMLLGWSNGWCGSLTIIFMNECGESDKERRFIGTLASFFLNGGLVAGSILGIMVERFILI